MEIIGVLCYLSILMFNLNLARNADAVLKHLSQLTS